MSVSIEAIQQTLDLIAAEHGATYVALQLHTLEDGRHFYSASLHEGFMARSANAGTLAEALTKAIAKEPYDATPKTELAA